MDVAISRQHLHRLVKWEYFWLCLLVLAVLVVHFIVITQPSEPLFDEKHYVPDARAIVQEHETLRPEHPPLGKLFVASGIFLFGDNPFGWRIPTVVFGAICIVLFYLICRQLRMSKRAAYLATFLLALDNLSFVQASIAMLDVFSLAFMLGSFWLYLKGKYVLSGVSVGLSALAKLNGALALPVIFLHWLLTGRKRSRKFIASLFVAPASFVLLMPLFNFFISRQFVNPIDQIKTMLSLSGSLTFATTSSDAISRPWDWILRPEVMAYWYEPHYLGAISFTIGALIIPAVLYMAFRAWKGNNASLFGISWFIGTYLVWIPASIITDRISFLYYFYPTVGAICIGLGLGLSQLISIWQTRSTGKLRWVAISAVTVYLLLHVAIFIILSPLSTWWSVPFLS